MKKYNGENGVKALKRVMAAKYRKRKKIRRWRAEKIGIENNGAGCSMKESGEKRRGNQLKWRVVKAKSWRKKA